LNASFVKGQAIYDPINKQITLPFAETSILVDGQDLMNRTFYVDAVNGNDNNDGSSGHPFKTLKKAFYSIPVGGVGYIKIVGVYDLGRSYIETGHNKVIYIEINDNSQLRTSPFDYDDNHYGYGTIMIGSNTSVRVYITNTSGKDNQLTKIYQPAYSTNKSLVPYYQGMFGFNADTNGISSLHFTTRVHDSNTEIIRVEQGNFFYRRNWDSDLNGMALFSIAGHYTGKVVIDPSKARLASFDGVSCSFVLNMNGYGIKDLDDNNVNTQDIVAGIIKDSNGVPRNILSNIVF
jgi:hypothetical protein